MADINKLDPSRTQALRNRLFTVLKRRYAAVALDLKNMVVDQNGLGLAAGPVGTGWVGLDKAARLKTFVAWLDARLTREFPDTDWPLGYFIDAYTKGVGRSHKDVVKGSPEVRSGFVQGMLAPRPQQIGGGLVFNASRSTPQYRGEGGRFVTEQVHLLTERFKNELAGANTAFAQKAARLVADAINEEWEPDDLSVRLKETLDITVNRARAIAETEIIRAQAEAQLDGYEALGVEEVEAAAEWITRIGACALCSPLAGVVLSVGEARGMIPRHTHCKCAWKLVNKREPGMKTGKYRVDRAIATSQRRAGDEDWGPAVPVTRSRPPLERNIPRP